MHAKVLKVLAGAIVDLHHINITGLSIVGVSLTPHVFSDLVSSTYDTFRLPVVGKASAVIAVTKNSMA